MTTDPLPNPKLDPVITGAMTAIPAHLVSHVGTRLRAVLRARGLTSQWLAGHLGVTNGRVSHMLRTEMLRTDVLGRVAYLLQVPAAVLDPRLEWKFWENHPEGG